MATDIYYIASCSGGKDSVAMVLRLIKEKKPLTHVVFYDAGNEFSCIYKIMEELRIICELNEITFVYLKAETDFLTQMLLRPINFGKENEHYGFDWCGGACRWRTGEKIKAISNFISSLDKPYKQYIGIAYDEPKRVTSDEDKIYPLVEWQMTEQDCLDYCYENGISWKENGIELYRRVLSDKSLPGLTRVSCRWCKNKNLDELRFYFNYLYDTAWTELKALQSRIDRPFYHSETIFDLEKRFRKERGEVEYSQCSIFDYL